MTIKKFDFYEEVRVNEDIGESELRGKIGIIMGISEEDGIVYGYSVHFKELDHSYYFRAHELTTTGKKFPREDFY